MRIPCLTRAWPGLACSPGLPLLLARTRPSPLAAERSPLTRDGGSIHSAISAAQQREWPRAIIACATGNCEPHTSLCLCQHMPPPSARFATDPACAARACVLRSRNGRSLRAFTVRSGRGGRGSLCGARSGVIVGGSRAGPGCAASQALGDRSTAKGTAISSAVKMKSFVRFL